MKMLSFDVEKNKALAPPYNGAIGVDFGLNERI